MKRFICHFGTALIFALTSLQGSFLEEEDYSEEPIGTLEGIDHIIEELLTLMNVPGAAVGIIADGHVVHSKGYGLRNVEHVLPVTENTLFSVGSATKSFTSMLLGMLNEEGKLNWDDPVAEHIPFFKLKDAHNTYEVTIRDFLTHCSGYPRHDGCWFNEHITREELIRRFRHLEPSHALREKFIYQNIGYAIAGHVAETVEGKPYEDLIQDRIFNPLGMTHSTFSNAKVLKSDNYALGYRHKNKELFSVPFLDTHAIAPGGGMSSSLSDMLKWAEALLNNGKGLVNTATWKEIISPQAVSHFIEESYGISDKITMESYGLGWILFSYRGHYMVLHGGNIDGFSASIMLFPHENIAIIVLTNKHLTLFPMTLGATLADKLLGLPSGRWIEKYKEVTDYERDPFVLEQEKFNSQRHENTEPSHPLHEYQGSYYHPGYGKIDIAVKNNYLEMDFHNFKIPLAHWHYDVFTINETANVPILEHLKISFSENLYGDIAGLAIPFEPTVAPIYFTKQKNRGLFDGAYLDEFTGNYNYHGFTFSVERIGEKLIVQAFGQAPFELVPERPSSFSVKGYDEYEVIFLRNETGRIVAVQLLQGGDDPYTAFRY